MQVLNMTNPNLYSIYCILSSFVSLYVLIQSSKHYTFAQKKEITICCGNHKFSVLCVMLDVNLREDKETKTILLNQVLLNTQVISKIESCRLEG